MAQQPPHILYLHSHDTGRHIQPYGAPVHTPNLQRLADQGVTFRHAFCAAPTCSPSRAALLLGQSPHRTGMFGLHHRGWSLSHPQRHLAHFLQDCGYRTARAGVHHVCNDADTAGYTDQLTEMHCGALRTRQAVSEFLQQRESHKDDRPLFLAVGFGETHRAGRGFAADYVTEDDARSTAPMPGLPNTPDTRRDAAEFNDSARRLDQHMGDILDRFATYSLTDNTLVICTTDHGIPFPGHKCNLTARGLGVMLILRGPKSSGLEAGRIIDPMVSHLDLYPTICDLIGAQAPDWLEGRSLLPLVRGETDRLHNELFGEVTHHAAYEPMRSLRTERYAYVRRFGDRKLPVVANSDDGPSRDVWLEHGWADQTLPDETLYDLVFDPDETHNLAHDPAHADTLQAMRDRLDRWMQTTEDPIRQGPPPIPEAGVLVSADNGMGEPERVYPAEPIPVSA
ncbi:MAG: sulfatase [Planctomycetota bacterium]